MSVHQVVTGALNKGESVFAVGNVEGINFTACAVGCDVVILASDFERVQVIPSGNSTDVQVSCLDSCSDSGKIAAAYGRQVRLYEPTALANHATKHKLDYRWFKTSHIEVASSVTHLSWHLEGLRLLVACGSHLYLYEHKLLSAAQSRDTVLCAEPVTFNVGHPQDNKPKEHDDDWLLVWSERLSSAVRHVKYSPDGMLFATCGLNDRLVRVWYQTYATDTDSGRPLAFDFTYLHHPQQVLGFEWRKTGRYMPRNCLPNILVTWCSDNISRIWSETLGIGDLCDLAGDTADMQLKVQPGRRKLHHRHYRLRHVRHKIGHRLKQLTNVNNNSKNNTNNNTSTNINIGSAHPNGTLSASSSALSVAYSDEHQIHPNTLRFHLATTVNAETDCYLVPSLETNKPDSTFAVHWLNNKELVYSMGAEKLLSDALADYLNGKQDRSASPESDGSSPDTAADEVNENHVDTQSGIAGNELVDGTSPSVLSLATTGLASEVASTKSKDELDVKLEALLRQWHNSADILFTIHPIDGSLLVWTLDGLDELFKQPTLSFSFRFPNAFPMTDAVSLCHNLCTFNPHHPAFVDVLQRHTNKHNQPMNIQNGKHNQPISTANGRQSQSLIGRPLSNTIFLLTNHENGSLNLWQLSVDEKSNFSTILNIAHKSRMCGHRFRIDRVVCHPVLPLLLTTSHHRRTQIGSARANECALQPDTCESELIMWTVQPVGPLCHSGGVRELARINSAQTNAFVDLAWVPTILPSSTLGSICNSPSSCFVASDGSALRLYQVVIDARGLLSEISTHRMKTSASDHSNLSSPEHPKDLHEQQKLIDSFDVISSQSTARPGCILRLDALDKAVQDWGNIAFLHVYHERTLLGSQSDQRIHKRPRSPELDRMDSVVDHSHSAVFNETFYVVLLEKRSSDAVLHMWKLVIASQQPSTINHEHLHLDGSCSSPEPDVSAFYPQAPNNNPQTAARVYVHSDKVYSSVLALPPNIQVQQACASAGHLPSSSLYPACSAPYLMVTTCDDDTVKFWRCLVLADGTYDWVQWKMISDTIPSSVDMEGSIYAISSACSSRWACAYRPVGGTVTGTSNTVTVDAHTVAQHHLLHKQEPTLFTPQMLHIGVFECESTGGLEWIHEDTLQVQHNTRHTQDVNEHNTHIQQYDFHDTHSPVNDMLHDFQHQNGHHQLDAKGKGVAGGSILERIASVPRLGSNMRRVVSDHALRSPGHQGKSDPLVVHLDWVSTEDGSHVLTVGVQCHIYLYTQVSQDVAQQTVTIMKEDPNTSANTPKRPMMRQASSMAPQQQQAKPTRWVCVRCVLLKSTVPVFTNTPNGLDQNRDADGLLPTPIMLSWVRDGVLVIGMESEMRVYNQWNIGLPPHTDVHSKMQSIQGATSVFDSKQNAANQLRALSPLVTPNTPNARMSSIAPPHTLSLHVSPSVSMLDMAKRTGAKPMMVPLQRKSTTSSLTGNHNPSQTSTKGETIVDIISDQGLFEAARWANPMLPQYHPKQLMALMNAGKSRRVKAILLHVLHCLRSHNVNSAGATLNKQDTIRKHTNTTTDNEYSDSGSQQRRKSVVGGTLFGEDVQLDYDQIESIPPLPLYALLAADTNDTTNHDTHTDAVKKKRRMKKSESAQYDELFNGVADIGDLDDTLDDEDETADNEEDGTRSRLSSHCSDSSLGGSQRPNTTFLAKHSRMLTRYLTHLQLPGMSSVDQMHLLALADTLSHFSANVMDKLTLANAAIRQKSDESQTGIDSVDECGLRFLMAAKQHEYLLKCLPIKQRASLTKSGLSMSHIIWALHSESESELLNCVPCMQRAAPTWPELRAYGVVWWVNNQTALRTLIEKLAKAAFQLRNDPMDAALYYLAMRKKNVVMHLFKTARDTKMSEFFANNFNEDKWKKAALKNAFVLMSKQRFAHAAAFFLLGDALKDAVQTCVNNLNDLQLAMCIIRLYETDQDKQSCLLKQLLCKQVLDIHPDELLKPGGECDQEEELVSVDAAPNPFVRSMAFWLLKDYARAASTLLDQVHFDTQNQLRSSASQNVPLSHVFYFYSYLRTHPLVVRQRLALENIQVSGTEKFLQVAKLMERRVTPAERRLYFMAAAAHMKAGCAMLGLDVLSRLPPHLCLSLPKLGSRLLESVSSASNTNIPNKPSIQLTSPPKSANAMQPANEQAAATTVPDVFDWSTPLVNGNQSIASKRPVDTGLQLQWSDDDASDSSGEGCDAGIVIGAQNGGQSIDKPSTITDKSDRRMSLLDEMLIDEQSLPQDTLAQQVKFVCCLKMFMEELATLVSGAEVESGKLHAQLCLWLEREVQVLHNVCGYNASAPESSSLIHSKKLSGSQLSVVWAEQTNPDTFTGPSLLHEALRNDRDDLNARLEAADRRRTWLWRNQQLLRTLAAYCGLHGSQSVGLASARMELLLLLLELQQDNTAQQTKLDAPMPVQASFPLLSASVASFRTSISDPIKCLQSQAFDLLNSIVTMTDLPGMQHLSQMYLFYGLSQCLSACLYESLAESVDSSKLYHLARKMSVSASPTEVSTIPSKWPGVDDLVAVMSRDRDDDCPKMLVLLCECFCASYIALFAYALTAYDSRWLYRLSAHSLDTRAFAVMFGGGGYVTLQSHKTNTSTNTTVKPAIPPKRPPPPPPAATRARGATSNAPQTHMGREASPFSTDRLATAVDPASLRAKFHAKLFAPSQQAANQQPATAATNQDRARTNTGPSNVAAAVLRWVPPKRSILSFLTAKPDMNTREQLGVDYDSDQEFSDADSDQEEEDDPLAAAGGAVADALSLKRNKQMLKEHLDPDSYAWKILRLALVRQIIQKVRGFLQLCGLHDTDDRTASNELAQQSPLMHGALVSLNAWQLALERDLDTHEGGCPDAFLPHSHVDNSGAGGPSLRKYRTILEPDNSPFDSTDNSSLPVRRLWAYLVRQEHLMDTFIRYIFRKPATVTQTKVEQSVVDRVVSASAALPEPFKITHRELDPITAFAVCSSKAGWLVVSTGRELQEMDVSSVLSPSVCWLHDAAELDIELAKQQRDSLRDNDDYVLFDGNDRKDYSANVQLTPFLVDRSRKALRKLCKRQVNGIRRMAAHPQLPYYLSGASDGSVRLWEWGVAQPLYTPRPAAQFAKVTCVRYSNNGGKFGITDGDGMMCLWQAGGNSNTLSTPYFNQKCHSKSAAEFRFLGDSSSLLITAGYGTADHNLALWDTLLPPSKAMIQSWSCHPEGASCCLYLPGQQIILSGGRSGQLCLWDVRNRQLRQTIKAFDHATVKSLALDPTGELFVAGGSDGDIKVYSCSYSPSLVYNLASEHATKSGFSLRQVGAGTVQGVQMVHVDAQHRLFTCGGDASLKLRQLPSILDTL